MGSSASQLNDGQPQGSEGSSTKQPFAWRATDQQSPLSSEATTEREEADRRGVSTAAPVRSEGVLLRLWDLAAILVAFTAAGAFGGGVRGASAKLIVSLLALAVLGGKGAYRRTSWLREHPVDVTRRLVAASTIVGWVTVLVTLGLGRKLHLGSLIIPWLALPTVWFVGRRIASLARTARPERILIVGNGVVARRVRDLSRRPASASVIVGCLDDGVPMPVGEAGAPASRDSSFAASISDDPPILGGIEDLPRILSGHAIDRVVVAFSSRRDYETLDVLRSCASYGGTVDIVPRFFDFVGPEALTYRTDGLAFVSVPGRQMSRGSSLLKRLIDIAGAGILIVAVSPLMLIIAVAILLDGGRPVLFRQRRIGMHGVPFSILKFRTLRPAAVPAREGAGLQLTRVSIGLHVDEAKREAARRATRIGAFLRRTSLDELPQLVNVIVGDMSLVGPRPLSPLEDAVLDGWESLRRDVRPGITGLWQVSDRTATTWESRVNLDYAHVRHWSWSADLHVLADTVRAVLRRRPE
jgi:exopolysaccharide biosynthesis polyprenyl glycosylphosphotransferase